MAFNLHSSSF